MEKELFARRLERATKECLTFTRSLVTDDLPDRCVYRVYPNKHGAMKALKGDAEVFPEDSLPPGRYVGPLEAAGVVEYLWRNGKVPEWINLSVGAVEGERTVITLWCCGHFMSLPANTFHRLVDPSGRAAPFEVHGPARPDGWKKGETGKFSLAQSPRWTEGR